MKSPLTIDKRSGRISSADGVTVFDPKIGPPSVRPSAMLTLFEGTAEGEVRITISFSEIHGGCVVVAADHPQFGTGASDWTEENERARAEWLSEFLRASGTPVGSYPWGKVEAAYNPKTVEGLATVSYTAQQAHASDVRNARA
jgi:hypothetical protein